MATNKTFDGSTIAISPESITVTEGEVALTLHRATLGAGGYVADAAWHVAGMVRAGSISRWTADRIVFCFGIGARAA